MYKLLSIKNFNNALKKMGDYNIVKNTPLNLNERLSKKYNCNIFFKREDLQSVRSFKIRGAFNKIINTYNPKINNKIVTVSAGNHAQGVSLTCATLDIDHHIFLPKNTPLQKINRIKYFGKENLKIHLEGYNFDESLAIGTEFCKNNEYIFIHPFDDIDVITGQGTIGVELFNEIKADIIIMPIGGGGLISGVGLYSKLINPDCLIYGVEPYNANSMEISIKNKKISTLNNIDTFVDGASVKTPGINNFNICNKMIDDIYVINNNKLSYNIIDIYQNDGIVLEPAGALSISCLDMLDKNILKNKNVVCLLSGGNNDISRYSDILEKSLLYQNLKHYFLITFNQTPGQLKNFINNILGENDDISRFEYLKKNNKNQGVVLLGIELQNKNDIYNILEKMNKYNFDYIKINSDDLLYTYLI